MFQQKGQSFSDLAPVVHDDVVYFFGAGFGLYAFAAETGEVKWMFKSKESLFGPAISGDDLIVVSRKGLLTALDKKTGTKKWEATIDSDASGPAILDGQIFLVFKGGEIRAYALTDGSFKWKTKTEGGARTSLVLFRETVFYGGRKDSLVAIDARTGLEKWKFQTNLPCHYPIIAGDTIYTTCGDRKLYAINPLTGQERWRLDNKKAVPPPPTFADGIMYTLGSDGFLYAMR